MAERRMFTNKITESDAFLDMPLSAQSLYFHLCMNADDDGFVKNPKRICRMIGASEDDFKLLIAKSFVMIYDNGIIVIKHWRMHNLLRKDRYKPTEYTEEKAMLYIKENKAYTFDETQGIKALATNQQPNDNQSATQDRLGKDSIDKDIKEKGISKDIPKKKSVRQIIPPTLEMVQAYCSERNNGIDPEEFIDFYTSKGWCIGKDKMKDWQATVRTWEKKRKGNKAKKEKPVMVEPQDNGLTEEEIDAMTDEEYAAWHKSMENGNV